MGITMGIGMSALFDELGPDGLGRQSVSSTAVDFDREVVCILGLPFDVISLEASAERVRQAAHLRRPLMISTANLNFVIAAQHQAAFRQSVIHSDLSLADGMPIIWIARLLGLSLPERVPGAGLFELLWRQQVERPLKVFFFGAPDGVAEAASRRVNAVGGGVRCVGFDPAGFGSVDSMSSPEHLARINAADPDFVVVSLGAQKGQTWIERNRGQLTAPVISHLGAVVGFAAGALARAPVWVQQLGLEWLWRIKEEPYLWRRYAKDAVAFARLLQSSVLPLWWRRWAGSSRMARVAASAVLHRHATHVELRLSGALHHEHLALLRPVFLAAAHARQSVRVNLTDVLDLDAYVMAHLLLLSGHQRDGGWSLSFDGVSPGLARVFRIHCVQPLLAQADGGSDATQLASAKTS